MADSLARKPACASRCALHHPLTWIKRRARRLQRTYCINRREAVENAALDWSHFFPTATH